MSLDTNPTGVTFSSDGTKMYVVAISADIVRQYTLTTPWDVSTASYDGVTIGVGGQDTAPFDLAFSSDGMRMFITGSQHDRIYQYSLTVPWDLDTASYDLVFFNLPAASDSPRGLAFSSDGMRMYVADDGLDFVCQFPLTVAWDLSTATATGMVEHDVSDEETNPTGVTFSSDGTRMYVVGIISDSVWQYSLTTPWDIASIIIDTTDANYVAPVEFDVSDQDTAPNGITFSSDGTRMYVIGNSSDSVWQYSLSTPWDISSAYKPFDVSGQETNPTGVTFSADGRRMYVIGANSDSVWQYSLDMAWDIASIQDDSVPVEFDVSGQETMPRGVTFSSDGTRMYVIGTTFDRVRQYSLDMAWDISTATATGALVFSVSGQETFPTDVTFSSDGTRMYVVGTISDSVWQYSLDMAWDIASIIIDTTDANYVAPVEFDVSDQDTDPRGVAFSSDGLRMYVVDANSDSVWQYSLTTPWDISSIPDSGDSDYVAPVEFDVSDEDTVPTGVTFSPDGTRMYMLGGISDSVHQYDIPIIIGTADDSLSISGLSTDTVKGDVTISLDITHPDISELTIKLRDPRGIEVTILDQTGTGADIDQDYALTTLAGTTVAGEWTLTITDHIPGNPGTLNSWSLSMTYDGPTTITPPTRSLAYRILDQITDTRSLRYRVLERLSDTRSLTYRVLERITPSRSLAYRILARITDTRSLAYRILDQITDSRSLGYRILDQLTGTRELTYRVLGSALTREVIGVRRARASDGSPLYWPTAYWHGSPPRGLWCTTYWQYKT